MAASFISHLTSLMTRLEILARNESRDLSKLRRYLIQNKIPQELQMRVLKNAQYVIKQNSTNLRHQEVKLLDAVSEPLKADIKLELYGRILNGHPFFRNCTVEYPELGREVV